MIQRRRSGGDALEEMIRRRRFGGDDPEETI